jgi:multidrug efflux pump subunit AcrA (membrane-fusion protein)
MKKKILRSLILIIIISGCYYGYKFYKKYSVVEADIERVKVEKGDVEVEFRENGTVYPKDVRDIYSLVNGTLSELFVKEGDEVKVGSKLAVVQPGMSSADKFVPVDVISPIDGVVLKCSSDNGYGGEEKIRIVGEKITGLNDYNPTCIMRVANLSKMIVRVDVDEKDVIKIKKGMWVDLYIDVLNKKTKGRVSLISFSSKSDLKKFPVEIDIVDSLNLIPNMSATVSAVLEKRTGVLRLPLSGLFDEYGESFVYLYNPETKKAKKTYIKTGLRNETYVEVISGLKEGDEVYTDKPLNIEQ